jgi:hypothetical protein
MQIFELRYPGTWIDGLQNGHQIQTMLYPLQEDLADAAIGLALFTEARARPPSGLGWMRRQSAVRVISEQMESALPQNLPFDQRFAALDSIRDNADLRAKRQEWAAGILPDGYERRLMAIHARTVVFALDDIDRKLEVLAEMSGVPEVAAAHGRYLAALPNVRDVRNSAHHTEDRLRGLKTGGKPITLQPISNRLIHAPGGAIVVSSFIDNRFGFTSADGHYREVEVTADSVTFAQRAIQESINAFSWRGPARSIPD